MVCVTYIRVAGSEPYSLVDLARFLGWICAYSGA